MFPVYGIIGFLLIIFGELNIFLLKLQPFLSWNFNFFWFGYILLIDSIVYHLSGKSWIKNRKKEFIFLFLVSSTFWWLLEFMNIFIIKNWYYVNVPKPKVIAFTISFSTIIPAFFETVDLLNCFKKFRRIDGPRIVLKNKGVFTLFLLGWIFLGLIILFPKYCFPLTWIYLFLILDSVNYLVNETSILKMVEEGRWEVVIQSFLAIMIMGFLWEFWNFWSYTKWFYTVPFFSEKSPKLFEMPLPGYLGYLPFSLEIFSFTVFCKLLCKKLK